MTETVQIYSFDACLGRDNKGGPNGAGQGDVATIGLHRAVRCSFARNGGDGRTICAIATPGRIPEASDQRERCFRS